VPTLWGKRMFDQGERAPLARGGSVSHTGIRFLTMRNAKLWGAARGTTFYFINDGPERA